MDFVYIKKIFNPLFNMKVKLEVLVRFCLYMLITKFHFALLKYVKQKFIYQKGCFKWEGKSVTLVVNLLSKCSSYFLKRMYSSPLIWILEWDILFLQNSWSEGWDNCECSRGKIWVLVHFLNKLHGLRSGSSFSAFPPRPQTPGGAAVHVRGQPPTRALVSGCSKLDACLILPH